MSKVPEFLPLYDTLIDKSEQRIDQLLTLISQSYNPLPLLITKAMAHGTSTLPTLQNDVRLLAYAYLRARNWDVQEALKMFKVTIAYRERAGLDHLTWFPSPLSIRGFDQNDVMARLQLQPRDGNDGMSAMCGVFGNFIKAGYHSYDKRGLPVAYWVIDKMDVKAAYKKVCQSIPVGTTVVDYGDRFVSTIVETGWDLCQYQDKVLTAQPVPGIEMGAPRRNFVTLVVDARGVTTKMLYGPVITTLKEVMKGMNNRYADCIHRILLVNCSSVIRFAFSILKSALNDGLVKKVTFVSVADTPTVLDRVIGKERVPSFLGGQCNCPGGCLASFNPSAVLSAEEDHSDVLTENIKLSAGAKHEKVFEMAQGEDVTWDFVSTKGVDIRFTVNFYPKQDGITVDNKRNKVRIDKKAKCTTREDPLVKYEKLTDGADSYLAPTDGILQLIWDNSHSYTQDKPVQMRVFKSAPMLLTDEE